MSGTFNRERRDSEVELQPVRDADREAVAALYKSIREIRDDLRVNVNQGKLVATRITVALSTLLRMPSAKPSPQMVSVVRSVHYLLFCLADEDRSWRFLLLHFTGRNVFASIRKRLAKVWSLLPHFSWEAEDAEASAKDDVANLAVLTAAAQAGERPIPPHIAELLQDPDGLVGHYRRRCGTSGWKAHASHLEFGPEAGKLPAALAQLGPSEDDPSRYADASRRDRFVEYVAGSTGSPGDFIRYMGSDASVFEVPPAECDPGALESFVLDLAYRFTWWHPSLTHVLGAYTEAIGMSGDAFVVHGIVEEDLQRHGYERMDRAIFDRGQRVGLHAAVTVALKVAEAMQYARFDAGEICEANPAAWCSVPMSAVYTRPAHGNIAVPATHSLDHLIGTGDIDVKFSPPPTWTAINRWAPPDRAVCPEAYGLATFLIAALTNLPPYHDVDDPEVIRASLAACAPPFEIPRTIPWELQKFCARAFAVKSQPGFKSLQHCRSELLQLYDLGVDFPVPHPNSAVPRVKCNDYGCLRGLCTKTIATRDDEPETDDRAATE
uniref:Uncharacterized protein n=1 Tax=Neobodo designis TaxID=312471 RepID=A0A7S1M0V4_NEODS